MMLENNRLIKTNRFSVLQGMSSINLFSRKDYRKYISDTGVLMQKSWERTGLTLKKAMNKVGGDGAAKKDGTESIA